MSDVEREQFCALVARLYQDGLSIRQIAVETHHAYGTIRRALVEANAPMRKRGWTQRPPT